MFGWFNKNPTKNLPVKRVENLFVDLQRRSFNGISGTACDIPELMSLGKASGYDKYPHGQSLSYWESGFSLWHIRGRIDSLKFYLIPDKGSRFAACQLEILVGDHKLLLQPGTTANEIMEVLGEPTDALDFFDDSYDVEWEGNGWLLNCAFDRTTGLEVVDVDFLNENSQ